MAANLPAPVRIPTAPETRRAALRKRRSSRAPANHPHQAATLTGAPAADIEPATAYARGSSVIAARENALQLMQERQHPANSEQSGDAKPGPAVDQRKAGP